MKTSQSKQSRLEIRLSEEDKELLQVAAYCIGMTPSQMVRMFIDSTINGLRIKAQKGEIPLEDIKAILDHKL